MAERAHVTSVEAIESFRANLIIYVSKARPALEEVGAEVTRTRLWLQDERRIHWEGLVRRRTKVLEQAQQALSSARMSNFREATSTEQLAVHRARRGLDEAEGKLKLLKHWNREFDSRVEPLVKQLEKLHTVLANDMLRAAAFLAQVVKTLSAYAEIAPPPASPASSAAPGDNNTTDDVSTSGGEAGALSSREGNKSLPGGGRS